MFPAAGTKSRTINLPATRAYDFRIKSYNNFYPISLSSTVLVLVHIHSCNYLNHDASRSVERKFSPYYFLSLESIP